MSDHRPIIFRVRKEDVNVLLLEVFLVGLWRGNPLPSWKISIKKFIAQLKVDFVKVKFLEHRPDLVCRYWLSMNGNTIDFEEVALLDKLLNRQRRSPQMKVFA